MKSDMMAVINFQTVHPRCVYITSLIEMQEDSPIHNNLFIGLNMQQRRHVSALFYGAISRSSMVTKEEIQQSPWGVLYIVGKLWRGLRSYALHDDNSSS